MKKLRFYRCLKVILGPIIKLCMRIKVTNKEKEYKGEGGLIVCANHISMLDCLTIAIAYKRPICFLAKKELFKIPLFNILISSLGAYGVDRGGSDVAALKKTISMLEEGAAVGIFPQGTRHRGKDIADTKFKNGAAMTAFHAHVPIQPVLIKTKGMRYRFLRKKEVTFGDVLTWEELGFSEGAHADYTKATEMIKERICALDTDNGRK